MLLSIGARARTHASTANYFLNWKWRGTSQSNYLVHKWSLMIKFENSNMPMLLLGTTPMYMQKINSISAAVNAWLRREQTDRQTNRHTDTHQLYIYTRWPFGPSLSVYRFGRCFGVVIVPVWLIFKVPQGMIYIYIPQTFVLPRIVKITTKMDFLTQKTLEMCGYTLL